MGRARELTELYACLPRSADPFATDWEAAITSLPGTASLASALGRLTGEQAVQLCMQALRVRDEDLAPRLTDAEFVATLPGFIPSSARSTGHVLREMLEGARSTVLAVGYEISDTAVIDWIHQAGRRAAITLICDRARGSGRAILESWPDAVPPPRVFQERLRDDATAYASMHGKALLVDGADLLLTSANFTFHGLHGNIELGVRLRGAPARRSLDVFSELLRSGLLEQVEDD